MAMPAAPKITASAVWARFSHVDHRKFLRHYGNRSECTETDPIEVVRMATVRKRTWKSGAETKTAWIADYFDQEGKRHIKTCKTKKGS
jgi:hypothetical protein